MIIYRMVLGLKSGLAWERRFQDLDVCLWKNNRLNKLSAYSAISPRDLGSFFFFNINFSFHFFLSFDFFFFFLITRAAVKALEVVLVLVSLFSKFSLSTLLSSCPFEVWTAWAFEPTGIRQLLQSMIDTCPIVFYACLWQAVKTHATFGPQRQLLTHGEWVPDRSIYNLLSTRLSYLRGLHASNFPKICPPLHFLFNFFCNTFFWLLFGFE